MSSLLIALFVIVALVGGVAITLIGPGGIFVTVALHAFGGYPAAVVAGTASATFIGTGLLGSVAYWRSGHLNGTFVQRDAAILSLTSIVGALAGSGLNAFLDRTAFGIALGLFVGATALLMLWRQAKGLGTLINLKPGSRQALGIMAAIGVGVGVPGGMLGVGGPVLAVPLLVLCGLPMLTAVAMAQVQSVFIACFATAGYVWQGAVDVSLALLIGLPLLIGTWAGWVLARRVNPARLKTLLAVVLLGVGVYLVVTAG